MKLFTITASIISLFAGMAADSLFFQGNREGHGFWCGKIAAEERVQREIFGDGAAQLSHECQRSQSYAEQYAKGDGPAGTLENVVWSFFSKSYASTPQ
jgi:hypothetical protein